MTNEEVEDYWAQLVSVTDFESSPIKISKAKFLFGRHEGCDVSFSGNKLVSGKHCYIEKDSNDNKVWLIDTSTNGTLLNMKTKISKGDRHQLKHGDEIHIVYKKDSEDENIGFLFQERELLEKEDEEESTQDYSYAADTTLSDDYVLQLNDSSSSGPDVDPSISMKRKIEHDEEDESESAEKKSKDMDEVTEDINKPTTSGIDDVKASTSKAAQYDDDMLDTLTCIICQEILHDCISLQPCMHSFCSGCYSEWMEQSNECPSCRMKVDRINKNHLVNNLVEAFLKARPDKKRPSEDLNALDEKNKITRDMLYPDRKPTGFDESTYSGTEESEDEDNGLPINRVAATPCILPNPFAQTQVGRPRDPVCRQCPNFTGSPATFDAQAFPDDDVVKTFPTAPLYLCRHNQDHVLCLCCMQPMPDRRREYVEGGSFPPIQCIVCYRSFCHAYWGCRLVNCNGCIGKFKDLNYGKKCLDVIILNNNFESEVFKRYLDRKNISVKDLFNECLIKFVTGQYRCEGLQRLRNGINTPVCYECGFSYFKDLAFAYRMEIPDEQFPIEITSRPKCHWGKNCRTQRRFDTDHARRYNHICYQTRQ